MQVDSTGDKSVLRLELRLEPQALLRLTAMPDQHENLVQLKLIHKGHNECNLDVMLNGQVMAMPKTVSQQETKTVSHRVQIGQSLVSEFQTSEKIALRACKERWALAPEQVRDVRQFMDRFQEEMAWKAPPREGPTGGMLAPSGGWPTWSVSAKPPNSFEGPALDAQKLFKKLSPSVFKLEAGRSEGTAQGSAVAISTTELVTNCHVVQGALKLVLKQETKEWAARLVRADPSTDRCVITADGLMMQPVAGIRTYESLEVGEPVYTLGSPVGLELTLSNGIVSGRREEKKWRYVQTTAPISPGSSGGGLFDAYGNLVGITTMVLVGRENHNQALNFAIAAETFWSP
jgi:S1-C subfamily serine protease